MTDGEIERLRRVAYGPGSNSQERAAAEEALQAFEREAEEESRPRTELPATTTDEEFFLDHASDDEKPPADEGAEPRRIGVLWLIPIVVGALAVGAVVGLGVTGQLVGDQASVAPSPQTLAPYPAHGDVGPPSVGNLAAVDRLFDTTLAPIDAFPDPTILENSYIHPADVRLLLSDPDPASGDKYTVWVAKNQADELCVIMLFGESQSDRDDTMWAQSCRTRADFERGGIAFGANQRYVSWDGESATVSGRVSDHVPND